jgi:2-polyprenyl-3-methyl-5-hydroxy-6-metoxy-1,4-benzoquinol methylase
MDHKKGDSSTMQDPTGGNSAEESVRRCYSTWGETYFDEYYGEAAPYPPVHRDVIDRLLTDHGSVRILDVGCGPASMLRGLARPNRKLYGFDLTPEMVAEGKRVFSTMGCSPDRLWRGSALDAEAYRCPDEPQADPFDACICVGVWPHLTDEQERVVLGRMRDAVRPGGLVIVEARNRLFSLFTVNRYSYDFLLEDLIRPEELCGADAPFSERLDQALDLLKKQFRMDLPPIRKGKADEPGYDEILSRTHNPLLLKTRMEREGFGEVRTLFYHYHALPPLMAEALGEAYREMSLKREDPEDWRGLFMASAFMVAGIRA